MSIVRMYTTCINEWCELKRQRNIENAVIVEKEVLLENIVGSRFAGGNLL